jgi:protoheme IX farnesyltransferase
MKPRSEWNTWVGALVGAVPPVMGWTAAGGSPLDPEALWLASSLFLWQFPHFFALSWMHRVDYERGGFQMVPVNDPTGDRTAQLITRYTWYMSTLPFIATLTEITNSMFAIEGLVLNAYALKVAHNFDKDRTNANARKVFLTSLWYLPCLLTLFILHSKTWRDEETTTEATNKGVGAMIQDYINLVCNTGRSVCVHEQIVNNNLTEDLAGGARTTHPACPISMGKDTVSSAKETAKDLTVNSSKGVVSLEEK